MSIFITNLAFQDGELIAAAKAGILLASVIAGVVGWRILKTAKRP
jgi:NhaA family Na+:H+ antiporter